jgi:glycosyltransferase involved in cell wall biosynthesis
LDRLVEALALIPALDLVVAGNDDEGYWPQIEQRLVQLSLADRVRRLEFVEGHAKQLLIAEAMLLVLPSYSENFGNVVLEAMALGTPVIVTPQVGLAMVVAKTRSGLVTEGEPSKLANAIRALASDEALRIEMGENGITTAAGYSWDRIAEQMEVEYASMSSR